MSKTKKDGFTVILPNGDERVYTSEHEGEDGRDAKTLALEYASKHPGARVEDADGDEVKPVVKVSGKKGAKVVAEGGDAPAAPGSEAAPAAPAKPARTRKAAK